MELSISAYNDTDKLLRGFYAYISEFYGDPLTVYFARSEEGESAADQDVYEAEAEKLLDDYGNSILRLAYSYLHNMSDAEDVLQDTLIQYLKAAPDFENAAHDDVNLTPSLLK